MRRCIVLLLLVFSLSGCTYYAPPGENHPVRVVTQIDVITTQDGALLQFHYRQPEKMKVILTYLRHLKPSQFKPITPDTFRSDAYEIRLTLSDGSQTVYHQIYDEYLQKNGGPWKSIDRVQGGTLYTMLSNLPSDQL